MNEPWLVVLNVDSYVDQATQLSISMLADHPSIVELVLSKGAEGTARNSGGFGD
ncbi:hypothetical protein [Rhizobium tubonense]|uniref:hypothetical protein n=1 Tax=Rhizobium tubonense TaxID=484088 RepID=UPI0012B69793|nr:hypothetical protein [Rhizobium tubonense]